MTQEPKPESFLLKWRGDSLTVTLTLEAPRKGRAAFRTNLGRASVRRQEIIDETERGITPLARAWTDVPMDEVSPGVFRAVIPLDEVGIFSGKACFFPEGSSVPEWPEGRNLHVKVESAETRKNNSIYCVFPRQFGSFREIVRRLPVIMHDMGFRIIQTLPPFPVPTTYAVMGEYGCPFAATDFFSVDPAMAEFDTHATPLDQFRELIGAVHARGGLLLVDLPANHTGWGSALQTHHPEWFRREPDGSFHSPGAWGVVWSDLVELDYANAALRAYMADVFLFWCRLGVDGFRCDAGYMIPAETWSYIVAKVRGEYPDTVFLLEGLGGRLEVTDRLLAESGLDWAYSEIFQTYDRAAFEWYLPQAAARAERYGALVHFAETHDNDRLAVKGACYARLRVQLAALLSWQGAWGIANGVEWYCTEKIDVHGRNDLNWGAEENMVALIGQLNRLLDVNPSFSGESRLSLVVRGGGNTLAVVRQRDGYDPVLVVANLDCSCGATVEWDVAAFPCGPVTDLLTGETVEATGALALQPGEVRCLQRDVVKTQQTAEKDAEGVRAGVELAFESARRRAAGQTCVHVVMPRDAKRDVVVPEKVWVEVASDCAFRLRLIDPCDGRTVCVYRSAGNSIVFESPSYAGDGTRCRRLHLDVTRYVDGRAVRTRSGFFVPPPSARARVGLSRTGEDVRAFPDDRIVLSNGAGAMAQLRHGWGSVASQYDAILSANPNPTVPSDRLNLWTRTRCWLQREGYLRELDAKCVVRVSADPAGTGACWEFRAPCGMGREASFRFELSLACGVNAARLKVTRTDGGENDVRDRVRLVFRPDLEWRSYHATTKAFAGPERVFAAASRPVADGVDFAPYGETFALRVTGGTYHHEPEWAYAVPHPEEAARGQEPTGDLFSPGWISSDLCIGETVTLVGTLGDVPSPAWPPAPPETATLPFAPALRRALELFIVRRDDLKTVIAGYPWFLDWGRDTFIFLRGMIAAGQTEDVLRILQAFAAFEENGTLPNIIYGKTAGNRDTTDAPLWFIRCVEEVEKWKGGKVEGWNGGKEVFEELRATCESIVENYLKGTPNGIRVDKASGLVWSPSHFTWMDTNYPACTPRVGYPVEIQALWISALKFLGRNEQAEQALASVVKYFKIPEGQALTQSDNQTILTGYYDCLAAPNGEPAAQAVPETTVRPNQLFLLSLGVLDDPSILRATEPLLVPGGIRSLASGDPLYRGVYGGDEDTLRKPAYHNGTVWSWPFPQYAEALVRLKRCSKETARAFLAGAVDALNAGCLGHISEIADGDAPHAQKGCCAQAWGVSELLRVWLKLGGK